MVLDGTAVLAYVAYFGVTFGPTVGDAAMRLWRQWRPMGAWSRATRTEVG
jgi:hypothetical protein